MALSAGEQQIGVGNAIVTAGANATGNGGATSVQEKLNEYHVLAAPVEQAIRELQLARGMMRARAEDEINALSPALSTLSEMLNISTLDLLTASDRAQFLQNALAQSGAPVEEIRRRLVEQGSLGAGEQLTSLGLPDEQGVGVGL